MKITEENQSVISQLQVALETCFNEFSTIREIGATRVKGSVQVDATYDVTIADVTYRFFVEFKSNGQPKYAYDAVKSLSFTRRLIPGSYGVFCAPFISDESARICKDAGIGYLDLAGNCFIKFPGVYINISGRKNVFSERRVLKSLFSRKSSRVIRVLLSDPNKSWKVEELQKKAQVSLGLVSKVTKKLIDQNWVKKDAGFRLTEPESLLREWSKNYAISKQSMHYFYYMREISEFEMALKNTCFMKGIKYALTLFSGASVIAPYVRYDGVFAYVDTGITDSFIFELALKPVFSGANVVLINPTDEFIFYDEKEIYNNQLYLPGSLPDHKVVSPIQLFLDLKSYGGRANDAAEFLFEEVISKSWKGEMIDQKA